MYKENLNENNLNLKEDPEHIIADACNQFVWFELHKKRNLEEIKKVILEANLKTLEGYLLEKFGEKHKDVIEKVRQYDQDVFHEYNTLISSLKKPDLAHQEFLEILDRSRKIYEDFKYLN